MKHKHRMLAVATMIVAVQALAQTATGRVEWWLTGPTGTVVSKHTSQTACDTAAKARNQSTVWDCPRKLVTTAAPTPAPAPSPSPAPAPAPAPEPAPSPAPAPAPAPEPAPAPTGPVLYFSDCQPGAAAGCVPGNDANPGTQAAPKQNVDVVIRAGVAANTRLLLKRGGAFQESMVRFTGTTPPFTLDAWGEGPAPIWRALQPTGIELGDNNAGAGGPYVVRNIKFDGNSLSQWAFFLRGTTGLTLENLEVTGFQIALHSQNQANATGKNRNLTLRNSVIRRNSEMGMLGDAEGLLIEGNLFEGNNFSGSNFNHAIYLGGHGRDAVVRGNRFIGNSAVNGQCTGGNFTVHGQWDGLLIENNVVQQAAANPYCWGIVVDGGYASQEWFRSVVVRGNRVSNVGDCAICLSSAPGALVEGNVLINDRATAMTGVLIPAGAYDGGDVADQGAVIRNNVACFAQPTPDSGVVRANNVGATVSGNTVQTGAAASTGACVR